MRACSFLYNSLFCGLFSFHFSVFCLSNRKWRKKQQQRNLNDLKWLENVTNRLSKVEVHILFELTTPISMQMNRLVGWLVNLCCFFHRGWLQRIVFISSNTHILWLPFWKKREKKSSVFLILINHPFEDDLCAKQMKHKHTNFNRLKSTRFSLNFLIWLDEDEEGNNRKMEIVANHFAHSGRGRACTGFISHRRRWKRKADNKIKQNNRGNNKKWRENKSRKWICQPRHSERERARERSLFKWRDPQSTMYP